VGWFGVPCSGCARRVRIDADSCWGCGRALTAQERATEHARRVQRGRRWLGIMAVVFGVSGPIGFVSQKIDADQLLERLEAKAAAAAPEGMTARAHDAPVLGARFARERDLILAANLALAALLASLWWWGQRAPVAAFTCAVGLVFLVWIAQAVIDRSTMLDGFVFKLFALGAFAAALRAALAARRAAAGH
jgi:hypothetical protein